jgi:hypothetical protein
MKAKKNQIVCRVNVNRKRQHMGRSETRVPSKNGPAFAQWSRRVKILSMEEQSRTESGVIFAQISKGNQNLLKQSMSFSLHHF